MNFIWKGFLVLTYSVFVILLWIDGLTRSVLNKYTLCQSPHFPDIFLKTTDIWAGNFQLPKPINLLLFVHLLICWFSFSAFIFNLHYFLYMYSYMFIKVLILSVEFLKMSFIEKSDYYYRIYSFFKLFCLYVLFFFLIGVFLSGSCQNVLFSEWQNCNKIF